MKTLRLEKLESSGVCINADDSMGPPIPRKRLQLALSALLLIATLALHGCAGKEAPDMAGSPQSGGDAFMTASNSTTSAGGEAADKTKKVGGGSGGTALAKGLLQRKIVYTADVNLVAESLTTAQQGLMRLVRAYNGYVSETEVSGSAGAPRHGRWQVRVPVEAYDTVMTEISKLGEVQTISSKSEDVTAEFYDVQARIANKQVEESRLIEHLKKSTARLSEILQVESEISRVRGEIEQMQGRLRVLTNLSSLSTINVSISEVHDFVPPTPTTFGAQAVRTFASSVGALRDMVLGLALIVVALLPWLVVGSVVGIPAWAVWRRQKARRDTRPPGSS